MKKFLFAIFIVLIVSVLVYFAFPQKIPATNPNTIPTSDLTTVESVILGLTMALSAYVLESPSSEACNSSNFAAYVASTTPAWSNVFTDFSCDLKVKETDAIFIVQDKLGTKLLFEDGTWSPELDSPHWRIPNLPRLQFPITVDNTSK